MRNQLSRKRYNYKCENRQFPLQTNFKTKQGDAKINHNSQKEHAKINKFAKFSSEMLLNAENIALQSLQILYSFVLRAEIPTISGPNVVGMWQEFRTQYKSILENTYMQKPSPY